MQNTLADQLSFTRILCILTKLQGSNSEVIHFDCPHVLSSYAHRFVVLSLIVDVKTASKS